jgi:hypothetical protein
VPRDRHRCTEDAENYYIIGSKGFDFEANVCP